MILREYSPELRRQALHDLTIRARGGIFIYLATWALTLLWTGVYRSETLFVYVNSALLLGFALVRAAHYVMVTRLPNLNVDRMLLMLVVAVLASALHWGAMAAWIINDPDFAALRYPYLIIMAALGMGGGTTLGICAELRIFYPLSIFGPAILAALVVADNESLMLVALASFSLVYVFATSRVTAQDYLDSITNQQLANDRARQMEELSITDPLTGLRNRMYLNMKYNQEWKRCGRLGSPLSVLMLDLDHFKQINDRYGHLFGDACLKDVADVLRREVPRATDTIARFGGEEFIVILPDTAAPEAVAIGQRLLRALAAAEIRHDGQTARISASIGLACTVPDYNSKDDVLLMDADMALYEAKTAGRNRLVQAEGRAANST